MHGCALAFELAGRGAEVVVVERGVVGAEASTAAAGMLAPTAEAWKHGASATALGIGRASLRQYPAWLSRVEAASGCRVPLHLTGVVVEGANSGSAVAEDGARHLTATELVAIEPSLTMTESTLVTGEGWLDPRVLLPAVHSAARAGGASFVSGEVVAVSEGGITLRREGAEDRLAGRIVICAGAWTACVPGLERLPVRPIRGQMLSLRPSGPSPSRVVFCTGPVGSGYIVPRDDGRVLVGSTMEEVGFERGVTAAGVSTMLAAAVHAWPGLAGAEVLEAWSEFRPATPDGLPLLGEWNGVWIATGHHRNGVLLAPFTADLMAAAMLEGAPVDPTLAPGRFADR